MTTQPGREVHIHRAELNASVDPAEPVVIHIDQVQPDLQYGEPGFADRAAGLFRTDGQALAGGSRPGGRPSGGDRLHHQQGRLTRE